MTDAIAKPADAAVREQALDTSASYIVQAPAGSGKTDLLTRRFLKLLGEVDDPGQILAITFTRAAAAEMRNRVLGLLLKANRDPECAEEDDGSPEMLAKRALRHAEARDWPILQQPQLLNIDTIDSFCLSLAHRTPLLARLGGMLRPVEDAQPLYRLAARRTLQQLGGTDDELSRAISDLLDLRDSSVVHCESLISEMLGLRDRWQHAYVLNLTPEWQEQVRRQLERPFARAIRRTLTQIDRTLADPALREELLDLARFAGGNLHETEYSASPIAALAKLRELPGTAPEDAAAWEAIACLLLIDGDGWRKSPTIRQGFPPRFKDEKERFKSLVNRLAAIAGLRRALNETRRLPPPAYSNDQWRLMLQLFRTLRHAVAELRVVFAEQNAVDFVELGLAAEAVLAQSDPDLGSTPTEAGLAASDQLRHLLVDEFQDTSRRQHALLSHIVRGWTAGERRTCFLVGDPMQSIYLFRQAEVELFEEVCAHGLGCEQPHQFSQLRLSANFRSTPALVGEVNRIFAALSGPSSSREGSVGFTPSIASVRRRDETDCFATPVLQVHAQFVARGQDNAEGEIAEVLRIIEGHLRTIDEARARGGTFRVAVLARARAHLFPIAEALRERGIPFRAVEMEKLGQRQEVLDLASLLRALLDPMDRVAWLSVLRAPWCGLTLVDLHRLTGADERDFSRLPVLELLRTRLPVLSPDGQRRAAATLAVMEQALRFRLHGAASSLAAWVERAWHSLGGPACVDESASENVRAFFTMLADLPSDGIDCLNGELERRLDDLYALPNPAASPGCGVQLMTIHKSKGLEFEVVIVPSLHRGNRLDTPPLLTWLERALPDRERDNAPEASEILVAPIGGKGEDAGRLAKWVRKQKTARETEEQKRLLYVACTRARFELHLLGTATARPIGSTGEVRFGPGHSSSLLKTGWPAFEPFFVQAWNRTARADDAAKTAAKQVLELAAAADSPAQIGSSRLRRLPSDFHREPGFVNVTVDGLISTGQGIVELYPRPQGSMRARALGSAIHMLLEQAAQMLSGGAAPENCLPQLSRWTPRVGALLAQQGVNPREIAALANEAVAAAAGALDDPVGHWILAPHADARSEVSWSAWIGGTLHTVRVDRVFRAGGEPLAPGERCHWIIDYKTADRSGSDVEAFLDAEQEKYRLQLERYAQVLRLMRGAEIQVRLGLYYPLLKRVKWWSA